MDLKDLEKAGVDKTKLLEGMSIYSTFNRDEKKKADDKISSYWYGIYWDFKDLCEKDARWVEISKLLEEEREALAFCRDKVFFTSEFRDIGGELDVRTWYDPEAYERAKSIYENIESIRERINGEIEKLKTKKVVPLRKHRIEKLQKELRDCESDARSYAYCVEKEEIKDSYAARKAEFDALRKEKSKIERRYAEQIIVEGLKEHPSIICVERKDSELATVCNEIRKQIVQQSKTKDSELGDNN